MRGFAVVKTRITRARDSRHTCENVGRSSTHGSKSSLRPKTMRPRRARDMATTRRRTSRRWPTDLVRTRERRMKSFCCPWNLSVVAILAGAPKRGDHEQRCATTSVMRSFWPLYVVMIEIFEAGMPWSRM